MAKNFKPQRILYVARYSKIREWSKNGALFGSGRIKVGDKFFIVDLGTKDNGSLACKEKYKELAADQYHIEHIDIMNEEDQFRFIVSKTNEMLEPDMQVVLLGFDVSEVWRCINCKSVIIKRQIGSRDKRPAFPPKKTQNFSNVTEVPPEDPSLAKQESAAKKKAQKKEGRGIRKPRIDGNTAKSEIDMQNSENETCQRFGNTVLALTAGPSKPKAKCEKNQADFEDNLSKLQGTENLGMSNSSDGDVAEEDFDYINAGTNVSEQGHQSHVHPNTKSEPISNKDAASTQTNQGSKGSSDGEGATPTQKSQTPKGTNDRSKQKESKQAMPGWKQAESSLFAQIDGNSESQQAHFESTPSEYENTRATLLRRRAILFMNSVRTICPNSGISLDDEDGVELDECMNLIMILASSNNLQDFQNSCRVASPHLSFGPMEPRQYTALKNEAMFYLHLCETLYSDRYIGS